MTMRTRMSGIGRRNCVHQSCIALNTEEKYLTRLVLLNAFLTKLKSDFVKRIKETGIIVLSDK